MAAASGLPWADTRSYLLALETLLATSPDTDALAAWRSAKAELAGVFSASSAGARRALADLQASLARAGAAAADAAAPLADVRLRLEQVEARKAALAERVAHMAAERDASVAGVQRLLQATLDLKEEQRRLEAMKTSSSPHLQCGRARGAGRAGGARAHAPSPPADTSSRSTST